MYLPLYIQEEREDITEATQNKNNGKQRLTGDEDEVIRSDKSKIFESRKYVALRANVNEEEVGINYSTNDTPTLQRIASRWESMKSGISSLRPNRFLPLTTTQDHHYLGGNNNGAASQFSSGSLDEIFEKLKHPSS